MLRIGGAPAQAGGSLPQACLSCDLRGFSRAFPRRSGGGAADRQSRTGYSRTSYCSGRSRRTRPDSSDLTNTSMPRCTTR